MVPFSVISGSTQILRATGFVSFGGAGFILSFTFVLALFIDEQAEHKAMHQAPIKNFNVFIYSPFEVFFICDDREKG